MSIERRKRHFARYKELKSEYDMYFKDQHRDISDFIYNQGGRFEDEEAHPNDGRRRDENIIDSTATVAHRTLTSGMYGSISSPTAPWFRLSTKIRRLKENAEVKKYYDEVTKIILTDLTDSNFYTSAETFYAEYNAFATAAMQIDFDFEKVFNFVPYTIGQYYVDTDEKNRIEIIYRVFSMRARNVLEMFGEDNVSDRVKRATTMPSTGNEWIDILHVQEKNIDRDVTKEDSINKRYVSIYYEKDGKEAEPPLRVSGYDTKPFAASRFYVSGTETYGTGPGSMALGDTKMLQELQKDLQRALKKEISPPLAANANAGDITVNAGPSGLTWEGDPTSGGDAKLRPTYQISVDIAKIYAAITDTQNRIKTAFFSDLFFMLSAAQSRVQKTATEVLIAQQENLRLMGPVIERLHPEFLKVVIERCFDLEEKAGRLPTPPEVLQGTEVDIEIISLLAQAQKQQSIIPIETTAATIASLAQVWPEAIDKFDVDQAIDEIAEARGVPAGVIVPDEVVSELRALKEQRMLQEQQAMAEAQAINSAKELSQTDLSGNNALTALGSV